MKTKLTTIFKKSANTPPMWVCLLFALVISTNCWADPIDVTWDGTSGHEHPSGTTESPASDTKSGITVTTNWSTQSGLCVRTGCTNGNCYNFEKAPADNYIDITTDGKILQTVYVSIANTNNVANVTIAFSSASTYDGNNLESPTSISVINSYSSDGSCEVTAPSNARSARIHGPSAWGPYLHRIRVIADEATPCSAPVTISYKKSGSETGSAPADREVCTDNTSTITLPGKNTLVYDDKHVFVGWKKDEVIYAEGATYDITSDISNVEFTAAWKELNVTNLAITNPENNTIPLSWKIPGICDLSKVMEPFTPNGGAGVGSKDSYTYHYNDGEEYDYVDAQGDSPKWGQYGIGFPITPTTGIEWLSFDYKGEHADMSFWGALYNQNNTAEVYNDFGNDKALNDDENWQESGELHPNKYYWNSDFSGAITDKEITHVAIYVNSGDYGGYDDVQVSIRNVHYHVAGRADIDHIVLVRKAGSVPANKEDGDVIYTGTKSHFTDTDVKTSGTTYFYAVFAVYSDASVSSPVYVSHTIEAATEYTVTYAKGADNVTGDVPTEGNHIEGAQFTVAGKNTLARPGHHFAGWNDGTTDYAVGDTYTMPAGNVTLTAQWTPFTVPAVTDLTITNKENNTIPLSWSIPGKLDLSTATTSVSGYFINGQSAAGSYSYNSSSEELTVTYTASQWDQPGVAFPFTLSNLESVTFEYKGHRVFPEVVKADGTASYWDYDVIETAEDWTKATRTPIHTYSGNVSAAPLPEAKAITFCANPNENKTNESFYLRNVFYHVKDQVDIDHIVLMRKVGSAATGIDDAEATQLYSGTLSHFTDSEEKTIGTTYYYTVFAVDEDNYVSAATTVSATITNDTPHTVTYAKGDESVTGSVPTDDNTYVEGNNVTLAAIGDLAWSGHIFMGWSDGTDTYKPGDSYTMTDNDVTFTAQWRDIETPLIIPTGTTHLDANNYYAAPHGVYSFDVDGTGASTCIDIAANNYAEWKAKFTPGFYNATLAYGTTGWAVNVTLKIYDGETEVLTTTADTHSDGSGAHRYQKTWGLDLTNLDPDKAYFVRVIDTYSDATSNPKVGYLDFSMLVPTTIGDDALTRLDYNNITVSPGTVSFDVKNNSNPVTCLDIKDQNQADWYAYITPGYYKINLLYGTPEYSTNVTFSVIDASSGTPVFSPAAMTHSGSGGAHWYEDKTWPAVDLTSLDANKQYIIRVKDTYSSTGSKPKVAYVEFTPLIVSVPTETRLDKTNSISTLSFASDLDIDDDGNNDELMNLKNTNAEWQVKIAPDYYKVSLVYGAPDYSIKVAVKLIDPKGVEPDRYLSADPYYSQSGAESTPHHYVGETNVDLKGITPDKVYKVRIEDAYTGCKLRVSHLTFATVDPINVPNDDDTHLDKTNAFSTPATATDLDIDDDGNLDELMNLKNSSVNWLTKIEPGIYDVSLTYGTPSYSIKVSVKLINPDDGSVVKNLSVDGSHDYYYVSGEKDKPQRQVGVTKVDLSDINPNKTYKVQVSDEYGSDGCNLRVSHVEFAPITPISIVTGTSTRLDKTNTYSSLTMATDLDIDGDNTLDELMNLNKNKGNAAWIVQITPGIYDVKLIYGAPSYSIKVAVKLIDLSGEESVRYLSAYPYYYESGAENVPHYHTSTTRCDFSSITEDKIYKVVIEDAYDGTYGCNLRVSHLEFARPVDTHTRTGLTAGDYGTICLPYAVAAEDIHGADIFDMQGWPAGSVAVVLNEVDNMVAGRPYVFQAKATTATWSYYPEGYPTDAGTHNGLIGSYTKQEIPIYANNYMVYNNKLYYVDVLSYVGVNKAYINRTEAEAAAEPVAPAPGKRQIRLFLDGEQVITDIDQINDQMTNTKYMENGILYILREGKVYNAQGQLVK